MDKYFRNLLQELKGGFFSVYPNIQDIMRVLSTDRTPWFDITYEDGSKRSLAIVHAYDAYKIYKYKNLTDRINYPDLPNTYEDADVVFEILAPVISAWINEGKYLSCSRLLASVFVQLAEHENLEIDAISENIIWRLQEECEVIINEKTENIIQIAIQNLKNIGFKASENNIQF